MNYTLRHYFLLALLVSVFPGCDKQDALDNLPQFPENAKLKQVTSYMPGSDEGHIVEIYEYDDEGRLVKVSTPKPDGTGASDYKEYTYDDEGRLEKIAHYYFSINLNDYVILQTTNFSWSAAGLKTKEAIDYPETGQSEVHEFVYDEGLLLRTNRYKDNELLSYSVNEYNAKKNLIKSSDFSATGEPVAYKEFSYEQGLLAQSISFTGDSNERIREEKYVYDANKNLVIMQSIVKAPWISSTSYELHYEYFKPGM